MMFGIKVKCIILTHTMYFWPLLQTPVLLMTGFVVQGHIYNNDNYCYKYIIKPGN